MAAKRVDYDQIEPGWRAGRLSPQKLADEYMQANPGCRVTRQAICSHFDKAGIGRDLRGKIRQAATRKVAEQNELTGRIATTGATETATAKATDREIIESEATTLAGLTLSHQSMCRTMRAVWYQLSRELEAQNRAADESVDLLEAIKIGVPDTTNGAVRKALGLGGRAEIAKKLIEAGRVVIDSERKVNSMDEPEEGNGQEQGQLGDIERAARVAAILDSARARRAGQADNG